MRKFSLTTILLINTLLHFGQPVLTGPNTNFTSTEPLNDYRMYNHVSPGVSGANVLWDFSSITWVNGSPPITFTTVSSTPYASGFSNCNVCESQGFTAVYSYFFTSTSALQYY